MFCFFAAHPTEKADYSELQDTRDRDRSDLQSKLLDRESFAKFKDDLKREYADQKTVEAHNKALSENVHCIDDRLTDLSKTIDRLGIARVQNDHATQLSELSNQVNALNRMSGTLESNSKTVAEQLVADEKWKSSIADRLSKAESTVSEKADKTDMFRKTDITDFQNRTTRLDTIKADKSDLQTLVNHCAGIEQKLNEVSAPLNLLVNARKKMAGVAAALSPGGNNNKLNLNIPFGGAGAASGTSSLASLNSAATSASPADQTKAGIHKVGSGGGGGGGKFSLSGLLNSSMDEKKMMESEDPENPFSVLMPLLYVDGWIGWRDGDSSLTCCDA